MNGHLSLNMKHWHQTAAAVSLIMVCGSCVLGATMGQPIGTSTLVHEWTTLDFDWPSNADRAEALRNGSFVPERNILAGLKVYKDDVFVTIPRWRWTSGQPVTLAKVVTSQGQSKLRPYPNWTAQKQGDCQALQYVQSMEIDPNTGFMYVIDTGRIGIAGTGTPMDLCPAKIVVYDLNTDIQIESFELPADVVTRDNNFINDLVLDYVNGKVKFAYISDVFEGRLHVYNFETRSGHNLEDPSMKADANGSIIHINNIDYSFPAGLDGIAMSPDFKYVYYCALGGYNLYQIPTATLRYSSSNAKTGLRLVGRKLSQSDGLAHGSQHLFFGALGYNAVYYWDSATDEAAQGANIHAVLMETQRELVRDDQLMQWPDTFAMDDKGWLWFMSNRLHLFNAGQMDFNGANGPNMRIWKVFVNETGYLFEANKRTQGAGDVIIG